MAEHTCLEDCHPQKQLMILNVFSTKICFCNIIVSLAQIAAQRRNHRCTMYTRHNFAFLVHGLFESPCTTECKRDSIEMVSHPVDRVELIFLCSVVVQCVSDAQACRGIPAKWESVEPGLAANALPHKHTIKVVTWAAWSSFMTMSCLHCSRISFQRPWHQAWVLSSRQYLHRQS